MKKMAFLILLALGLLLIPCLTQASGIDPDNYVEVTNGNIISISEDSVDYTSISTSENGDEGTPVVTSVDPLPPVDDPTDPRDDPPAPPPDPYTLSAPTGLRIVVDGGGGDAGGGSEVTLAWDDNPESYLAGYKVYWDIDSGSPYGNMTNVGDVTTCTLSGLPQDVIYSAITAYDAEGLESDFSEELVINNVPLPPSVILLGTGLLGLGLLGWRRRKE